MIVHLRVVIEQGDPRQWKIHTITGSHSLDWILSDRRQAHVFA